MFSALIRPTLFAVFTLALVAMLSVQLPRHVSAQAPMAAAVAAHPVVAQATLR
jgi:hypothetical protein